MQKLLKELKSQLEIETTLHEGLKADLSLEAEQDGQMSSGDFVGIQQRKYLWTAQIEEAEHQRIEQVNELARIWKIPGNELTLRGIIARSPAPINEELTASRNSLKALVEEIRRLAQKTGANAQARLKAIDATLAVIGEAARLHPTYSGEGRIQQRPPTFKSTSA